MKRTTHGMTYAEAFGRYATTEPRFVGGQYSDWSTAGGEKPIGQLSTWMREKESEGCSFIPARSGAGEGEREIYD